LPDAAGHVVQYLVPRHALPLSRAPLALAPQRIEDALGIRDLVEGGRALGAVAAAAARMHRVALELLDLEGRRVHVGQQPAAGLAVEADGRDQRVAPLHLARPRLGVELLPVV